MALKLEVFEETRLGYNVYFDVEGKAAELSSRGRRLNAEEHTGLLFRDLIYGPLPRVGDVMQGYVLNIRPDGKVCHLYVNYQCGRLEDSFQA
eukprot:4773271-Pyramimonas_sp.AAC.1